MGWRDWRNRSGWGNRGSTTTRRPTTRRTYTDRSAVDYDIASNRPYNPATREGYYRASPEQSAARQWWVQNTAPNQRGDFFNFMAGVPAGPAGPAAPAGPLGPGGGNSWGGGGGGGGGGGMTQAMLDQMLAVLGMRGPELRLAQANLPAFRGTNLPAFNAAPYTQATNQLNAARAADIAAAQQAGTQATQALQSNYANAYANTPVAQAPGAPQVGVALQGTVGGGGDQAATAAESNAAAQSDQASFANLLGVLAAADQTAQNSRLNQVALDQGTALNAINAQQRGLLGGIGMARTQAANQWAQADAERRYQNSLMAQQWQREAMTRAQDLANQNRTANWTQRNELINNRLTPLLQLLGSANAPGLNLAGIQKLIAGLQR
jgi:hypothetical protein